MHLGVLGAFVALTLSSPARVHASEGVIELNQACGNNNGSAGCLPGDFPGLPVEIHQPGSYRLTSDLVSSFEGAPVISLLAEGVTVDLGGFTVRGPGVPDQNSLAAIYGGHRVTVRNGFVRFASNDGVQLGGSSRVEDLHVHGSGRDGVRIAGEGTIRNVVATSNAGNGITAGAAAVIDGCTATANGGDGIGLLSGTVRGSTATQNAGRGGNFGAKVSYATNLFDANAGGDLTGGHASGGNVCGDASCSSNGRSRYYMTPTLFHNAVEALTACAPGFHMAAYAEIADTSSLAYDISRGALTENDTGHVAPNNIAWIRSTSVLAISGPGVQAGVANCLAYTSASAGATGTTLQLSNDWAAGAVTPVSPWVARVEPCNTPHPVWCVED